MTAERKRLAKRNTALDAARTKSFAEWAGTGGFTADREPVALDGEWSYLGQIYRAVPASLQDLDWCIMKSAQGGASIWMLLLTLFQALRGRYQIGYFLPGQKLAMEFSQTRFIRLVRENPSIHRLMGDPQDPHNRLIVDEGSASMRMIAEAVVYFTFMAGTVTTEAKPLDMLAFDEVQEMLLADMAKAEERVSASKLKAIARVSTANFAGADIHHFFETSDQRWFHTRCACPDGFVMAEAWDPRLGPLCIGEGSGATPGVPREAFYFCPRCRTPIDNPRDGVFRARFPENAPRVGWQFPQMLSPRQSPRSILDKWRRRVDTKNFYNRSLGLPYSDPDTQPVTQAHCEAAQNPDLRWGVPTASSVDSIFMGVDQMGADNHIVIKGRVGDRMRLLHLEIVQSDNPFRRAYELMREYRIRTCGIEGLPNFNESLRFAKAFPARVFVVSYADLENEIVLWGDRPRDKVTVRKSDEDIRTRFTASVDQYKMMSWSLAKWANGEIETPDARTLVQRLRSDDGERLVQVCSDAKLGLWLHLQRVALVTEYREGKEDERKLRRAVKKVGIDPHFAFANMLCDVAWVRAYGAHMMLGDDVGRADHMGEPKDPADVQQVREQIPHAFPTADDALRAGTCGGCSNFDGTSRCTLRRFNVKAELAACDLYVPKLEEEPYP